MENLRWILIFAGVAILVLLYLSGRQPSKSKRQGDALDRTGSRSGRGAPEPVDPLLGDDGMGNGGIGNDLSGDHYTADPLDQFDVGDELDEFERPGGSSPVKSRRANGRAQNAAVGGLGGISSKIEAFGSKLKPGRKKPTAQTSAGKNSDDGYASKIVTLHVVAPEGQLMNGAHLLEQFEQRGYHYGDMNIFHSMHEGKTVFSIAKMVVPGTFDVDDVDSFQTPGISLILQLPGPVPADVAFEVLLSEAHEIADMLGATVLDADRSSLSKQTVQHMREGINDYMHKQKYFSKVPS